MAFYQLQREQFVNTNIEKLWEFMSSPKNLKQITPKHMGFDITSNNGNEKMYKGMIISYIVKPLFGISTTWVTEITQVVPKKYFIDEQRIGPYKLWHHQHIFIIKDHGVLMKDIVTYQPPLGFLGSIANALFIKKKLTHIFEHRFKIINHKFNTK